MRLLTLFIVAFAFIMPTAVQAADLSGTWERSNGQARVVFAPCSGGVCGKIAWLNPDAKSKARIGDKVYYNLVRDGAKSWKGKAYSPKEGKTYSATLTLDGATLLSKPTLLSKECLFGDRICRSETWTRVN